MNPQHSSSRFGHPGKTTLRWASGLALLAGCALVAFVFGSKPATSKTHVQGSTSVAPAVLPNAAAPAASEKRSVAPQQAGSNLPSTAPSGATTPNSALTAEPAVTPRAEIAAEYEGPVTATAALKRKSGETLPIKSIDGLFKQVLLDPTETIQIGLDLDHFDQSKPIRLVANNGGSINRRVGPTIIDPATAGSRVDFTFGVGATRGAYTVEALQGTRTELFDFWVGPLPPRGEAGPPRIFTGESQP